MALLTPIDQPFTAGTLADAYFRVNEFHLTVHNKQIVSVANFYSSQAARDAGKPPLPGLEERLIILPDAQAEQRDDEDNLIRPAIPSTDEMIGELAASYIAITNKLYELGKTVERFSSAQDVVDTDTGQVVGMTLDEDDPYGLGVNTLYIKGLQFSLFLKDPMRIDFHMGIYASQAAFEAGYPPINNHVLHITNEVAEPNDDVGAVVLPTVDELMTDYETEYNAIRTKLYVLYKSFPAYIASTDV